MTNIDIARTAVQTVATNNRYGNRTAEINRIATLIATGSPVLGAVQSVAGPYVGGLAVRSLASQIERAIAVAEQQARTTAVAEGTAEFDKATACEVIRAFITSGSTHLRGRQGATPEQVTALLQIAGLEDVPEPEVEAEMPSPTVLNRALDFARRHGFRG